ncbi:MAG TPA: PilZ domain-containing protein [Pyrinomonadaceae bacterium]|nr:PilZ domain-containing protein [Pyrinomonadaceae bacterium]
MSTEVRTTWEDDEHTEISARERKVHSKQTAPKLNVIVKGKDEQFRTWSENASLTSLSSSGAGLFLPREWSVGRLVSLMLPMPVHLRRYDTDKKLYRVWGLVQYCYEAAGGEETGFHLGVALIGRDAPESYQSDPNQSYRIAGMDRNGLWKIEELESSFKKRTSVRHWSSMEASLYQLDEDMRSIAAEKTVTENISETGASVFSDLRIAVGDCIKFQMSTPPFSSLCVVRHRRIGVDDRTRVHLEFIDNAFPVLEADAPIEEDGEH